MIKAFPKIFAIGQDYIVDLFQEEVEITEKIDGSQFAFGKLDGVLHLRSKGAIIYEANPPSMFKPIVDYVISIQDLLPDNTVFYGETLQNPKHNTLKYDRIPKNHFMLFGMCLPGDKFIDDYETLAKAAELLEVEAVPLIHKGKIENALQIKDLLERESVLGGAQIEGVVCKNYQRPFLLGGQPIPLMMGKYVSESFKEVHREKWGEENTARGRFDVFKQSFRTEARWEKAIQHMSEKGELENSPRDIGKLLKEIHEDIAGEEMESIKNFLWSEFKGEIMRVATAGFPEWYKERLLEKSFEGGTDEAA